jgi:hypothetical protein
MKLKSKKSAIDQSYGVDDDIRWQWPLKMNHVNINTSLKLRFINRFVWAIENANEAS